jgi:tRNA 2-selenouridine synthase
MPRNRDRPSAEEDETNQLGHRPVKDEIKMLRPKPVCITQFSDYKFNTVIDVRSPAEFEIDHIPGSINCPVLNNEERIIIGTLHKESPFEARRLGAAIISRNVANILENELSTYQKNWKPLIYCWRGGLRSGSLAIVMAQVGWPVHQLINGYKSYRHEVLRLLPLLSERCKIVIISGPTGSGKTHFLYALQRGGRQVLDLEGLACHRGSVLGNNLRVSVRVGVRVKAILTKTLTLT